MSEAAEITTSEERARKLAQIVTLPEQELQGWWWAVASAHAKRRPFEGEITALIDRAARIGVTLWDVTERKPRNG